MTAIHCKLLVMTSYIPGNTHLHCFPFLIVHPTMFKTSIVGTQHLSTAKHSSGLPQSQSSPSSTILFPQYEPLLWAFKEDIKAGLLRKRAERWQGLLEFLQCLKHGNCHAANLEQNSGISCMRYFIFKQIERFLLESRAYFILNFVKLSYVWFKKKLSPLFQLISGKPRALTIWMEFSVVFFSAQMELHLFSTKETK